MILFSRMLKQTVETIARLISSHTHNGADSKKLNTADFLKIVAVGPPDWTGREGEIVLESDGSSTFTLWAYLGGDWREFPYTP